ncbi:hypothetical protein MiSe_30880 [Microseira wollei NIES-4236]|uniref:Uncharacterized protein n=2 Tax=Microseira wollei TaxID=467598 RepID=A0AAV3XDB0_9CYAN|nr:hypothetical protein MiSe_30880 [Microseira wollei NIES-4236]
MSYLDQLHPWCIIRFLPNAQNITVCRLRRRSDAEAHLQILRQMVPTATYKIVFDGMIYKPDPTKQQKFRSS